MKTIAVLKNEVMKFDLWSYLLWIVQIAFGCYAYFHVPNVIIQIGDFSSFLKNVGEVIWGGIGAFIFGVVAILATKIGTQIWEDKLKPFYQRVFNKKKKKKDSGN